MRMCSKKPAYLTNSQKAYFSHSFVNYCDVQLDEITISGKFHMQQNTVYLKEHGWRQAYDRNRIPKPQYDLLRVDENGEFTTIASLIKNPFARNSWRIDTSNHLESKEEKQKIVSLRKRFYDTHITRLDIAFNFVNYPDAGMLYDLYNTSKKRATFQDRAGRLNGYVYGAGGSSGTQYRYYDKLAELSGTKKAVPDTVYTWERLELATKGKDKIKNWNNDALKMLNCFKCNNLDKLMLTDTKTFLMLYGLIHNPPAMPRLSKRTQAKYRKLIKENTGFDVTLSEDATSALNQNRTNLIQEIQAFMD